MLDEAKMMRTDYTRKMKNNVEVVKKSSTNKEKEEVDAARKVMDLSSMSLDFLPKSLLNLGAICKLDLSNNNLQNIPESLTARLLNMIVLDVRSNQLVSLPNSIGCLSKLKLLNVSGNLLKSLPRTIENCRSLEELNANFNILTELPDTIGFELTNLKKLSVNSNKLAFLPSSTSHLTNLKILDVRLNSLRSLPDDLENLYNLQTLNVSQNFHHLETLPYSIGLLINLVDLDVSYNKIRALPESIGCLRKIQKLSVEGNPLVSPPPEVMEQGIIVVKEYLCYKMNNGLQGDGGSNNRMKKKSWFGKLARCTTFGGGRSNIREGVFMPKSKTIGHGVLASPRYMGMFSPKRFFSPKSY